MNLKACVVDGCGQKRAAGPACRSHVQGWLAAAPPSMTLEDWLAAGLPTTPSPAAEDA